MGPVGQEPTQRQLRQDVLNATQANGASHQVPPPAPYPADPSDPAPWASLPSFEGILTPMPDTVGPSPPGPHQQDVSSLNNPFAQGLIDSFHQVGAIVRSERNAEEAPLEEVRLGPNHGGQGVQSTLD